MLPLRLLVVVSLVAAAPAFAQNKQHNANNRPHTSRSPVATQPSNNPFQNPINQGVPPAVSANPRYNSNRTNPPPR